MSMEARSSPHGTTSVAWRPPSDEELTWFPARGRLTTRPRPLEYTLTVQAFLYGVTHALESLRFPLYELRARLIDGQLYLASVPSGMAERDLETRMRSMRDSTLRFSRNIGAAWRREVRAEVAGYNDRMAAFPPTAAALPELAEELFTLKRLRANQWFASVRAVIAPFALLLEGIGESAPEDALAVFEDMRTLVIDQGTAAFDGAVQRVAECLVQAGSLDQPEDVEWLEYEEVQEALRSGGRYQATVVDRRAQAERDPGPPGPDRVGPLLPSDAPRMYLLREVLDLIAGELPARA